MTKQTINIGTPNKGDGDPLRSAFDKINQNFTELYGNLTGVIPNPAGQSGKVLTSNGTTVTWSNPVSDINQLTDSSNLLQNVVVSVGTTSPLNPVVGKLWYDTSSGRMYIFYDNNWVDANPR